MAKQASVAIKKTTKAKPVPKKKTEKVVKKNAEVPKSAPAPVPLKPLKIKKQSIPKQKKIKKVFIPFNPIQPAIANGKPVNTSKKYIFLKGKFELEYVIRCF